MGKERKVSPSCRNINLAYSDEGQPFVVPKAVDRMGALRTEINNAEKLGRAAVGNGLGKHKRI